MTKSQAITILLLRAYPFRNMTYREAQNLMEALWSLGYDASIVVNENGPSAYNYNVVVPAASLDS